MYRYLHFDPCLLQTTYVLYVITAVYDNMISKIYLTIITLLKKLHSHENEQEKNREVFNSAITGQCPHNIENTIMCTSYTFLTNKILAVFFY